VVAKGKKQTSADSSVDNASNVTRIQAVDTKAAVKSKSPVQSPAAKKTGVKEVLFTLAKPFISLGTYLKGAWFELKQVHWPNRRATWGLTVAVLLFSAFFIIVILLLDALFKYLFQLILG
jgi:preprotein translocase SecE subunit